VVLEVKWGKFQIKLEKKNIKTGKKTGSDKEHLTNTRKMNQDKIIQENTPSN
jgi:hypothetical protein